MPFTPSHSQVVRLALNAAAGSAYHIRIADLCRAAGVSERTLRNAFHAVYGLSPKRYLRRERFEVARRRLEVARGGRGIVTTVATDCGFFELGRFAVAYRELFGERPSDTARRREE
jgi:transcriptional regulator GlxA family with amidase domain